MKYFWRAREVSRHLRGLALNKRASALKNGRTDRQTVAPSVENRMKIYFSLWLSSALMKELLDCMVSKRWQIKLMTRPAAEFMNNATLRAARGQGRQRQDNVRFG